MKQVFNKFFTAASVELGCDQKCVEWNVYGNHFNLGEIVHNCGCGKGAWEVKTTKVNVLAATERVYGDLESLTQEDNTAIQGALVRLDM